jgi:hypothetical protein
MANQPSLGQAVRSSTKIDKAGAESIAAEAFGFLASDEERLQHFLDLSGLDPTTIRGAAAEPGFLAGVLDHLASHEELLLAFTQASGRTPEAVMAARQVLSPSEFEG